MTHGTFCWYELMTSDTPGAAAFYGPVVGWTMRDAGHPSMTYTLFLAGEARVAGLMALPAEAAAAGARPGWMGYVAVDDVDRTTARVEAAGGRVHRAPDAIPGIGRFAVVADPQGAAFVLFKGDGEAPRPRSPGTPGFAGWHELLAADGAAAFAFYADLFGWTKAEAIDMGPMGVYQLFAAGGPPVGGMMSKPADVPHPFWTYYFQVDGIEAAAARIAEHGGTVTFPPHEVPGGSWIVHGLDPQGARFALVSATK